MRTVQADDTTIYASIFISHRPNDVAAAAHWRIDFHRRQRTDFTAKYFLRENNITITELIYLRDMPALI